MKKTFVIIVLILCFNLCDAADISITVLIPDAYVVDVSAMMNARFPKKSGETTIEQAKRMIRELVLHQMKEYKTNIGYQQTRDTVVISTNTIK